MKYLFPLILITSTLFSQDILKLKSGKVYEGLYFGELDGKIIFKIKGESESKTFNSEEVLSVNKNQGSVEIKENPSFEQDMLLHKSGKNYKGRYISKENEVIIFRVEGEKDSRMFLINDVDIIIANREGAKVELYYPFNMQNNIEENDPEFWKRAAEAYLTGNKDAFLRQNTNPSPNRGYICLGSLLLFMLIAIVIDGQPSV